MPSTEYIFKYVAKGLFLETEKMCLKVNNFNYAFFGCFLS